MSKYSQEFKLKVVHTYLSGSAGQREIATSFQIGRTQLRDWLFAYESHGVAGLEPHQQQRSYSTEFKLSVLAHRRIHYLSLQETAAFFSIPSFSTIYDWEQRYNQGGIKAFVDHRGRPQKMKKSNDIDPASTTPKALIPQTQAELLREIEYLKAENAYLKKLEALILKKQLLQKTRPASLRD
jgi:transposase